MPLAPPPAAVAMVAVTARATGGDALPAAARLAPAEPARRLGSGGAPRCVATNPELHPLHA